MKKITILLLALLLIFSSFVGCQRDLPDGEETTTTRPAEETTESLDEDSSNAYGEEITTDIINSGTEWISEEGTEDLIVNDNGEFAFEYSIYSESGEMGDLFAPGERIRVVTRITNIGKDHVYEGAETDYRADVAIYCERALGGIFYLEREPIESTDDYMTHYINSGESREATYYFTVPDDAPAAWYTVHLNYNGNNLRVKQGIRIYDTTETDYDRSPVLISSGGNSIRPLSFFAGEQEYDENGEPYYTYSADYFGYYEIYYMLNNGKITADEIPMLVLSRDFAVTHVPGENQVGKNIRIRTVASDEVVYRGEISGLFELPKGEYLATMTHTFKETGKSYTGEEGHYIGYSYDMVFRLIVPDSSALELPPPEYTYSQTEIRSGENKVNPISCYWYGTWYDADGKVTQHADGYGVYRVFEIDENSDPKYFPTLIRDGDVGVRSTPFNAYISSSVRLFGLDFQQLEYGGGWEGLSELPAGDYLVVYVEEYDGRGCDPEPREYAITVYECMFRLIVTE